MKKDFTRGEILEAMEEQTYFSSASELEDWLDLDRDEIGAYSKTELLEMIYDRYTNEDLFEMFNLWEYFAEKED